MGDFEPDKILALCSVSHELEADSVAGGLTLCTSEREATWPSMETMATMLFSSSE
jgi:hypothetical protein